jgi:hypothetical protein
LFPWFFFSFSNENLSQSLVALLGGNMVYPGMVVLFIVPGKITLKILHRFLTVKEAAGILWSGFDSSE